MPYEIRRIGNEYCVFKVGTNDSLGCHESRSDAAQQIAAIAANEGKKQMQTGFISLNLANNQRVIGLAELCRVLLSGLYEIEYIPSPLYHITLAYGDNIPVPMLHEIASSFSFTCFEIYIDRFEIFENNGVQYIVLLCQLNPELSSLQSLIFAELARRGIQVSEFHYPMNFKPHITIGMLPSGETIPLEQLNQFTGNEHEVYIKDVYFSVNDYRPVAVTHGVELYHPEFELMMPTEKSIFKILNDNDWLAWYTNNFEDKEKEIISEEALREFVNGANSGLYPMPELWFHHIEGTRHGIAKQLFQIGHFTLAYGEFDDPKDNEFVLAMKSWYDNQDTITMSHWFTFYEDSFKDGVYGKIRTIEISTLPANREANAFTRFVMR